MSTVTFNGSRLNDAEASGGFGNLVGGGAAPAAEPQLKYQGNNAVNRKVSSTADRRGIEYVHGSTTDMTSASFPLYFLKVKVGDASDLNTTYGGEAVIGSSNANFYSYNVSGSGANNDAFTQGYSSQGGLAEGYLIIAINPNIPQWREGTTGSPSLSAINYFGFAAQFVTGGAKSENVAIDAVDVGLGLDYTGTLFTFQDAIDTDQLNINNRWGLACGNGSVITLRGLHRIAAGGVSTSGTDESTVNYPDGYHGTGDFGIEYNTTNNTVSLNGTYTGLGRIYLDATNGDEDTRPDLIFINSGSSSTHSGTFNNHRLIQLQSVVTFDGVKAECSQLTQNNGVIQNTEIKTDSASGVACLTDPNFANLSNVTFKQVGSGHAVSETTVGTYNWDGHTSSGYGADGSNDALFYNNSGGLITLNVINGGETPTVRNGTGASTVVNNSRSLTFTGVANPSKIYLFDSSLPETDVNYQLDGQLVTTGTYTYNFNFGANINAIYRIVSLNEIIQENTVLLDEIDLTIPINQNIDRAYENN